MSKQDHSASQDLSPAGGVKLDTAGHVRRPGFAKPLAWSDLDPFEQGYIEALFASFLREVEEIRAVLSRPNVVGTNDHLARLQHMARLGFSDLAPETLARIIADCADVLSLAAHAHLNTVAGGREFWARRQAGRYDAVIAPPLAPYLGDDGKVYLREAGQ